MAKVSIKNTRVKNNNNIYIYTRFESSSESSRNIIKEMR